jgi:uncharacterized membrane protein
MPIGRTGILAVLLINVVGLQLHVNDRMPPWWLSLIAVFGLFVAPMRLVGWKVDWRTTSRAEQMVYSGAVVLLALLVLSLVLNTTLPLVGVRRPLDPLPVLVMYDVAMAALVVWRRDRVPRSVPVLTTWVPYSVREVSVVGLSLVTVVLVTMGSVRLNNDSDLSLTLYGLLCFATAWVFLLKDRYRLRPGPINLSVYALGLSLLLMTSMRGWLITGHDVQREFRLSQIVLRDGVWDIATYRDAYNACLSITILPTVLHDLTGMDPVYVMKVVPSLAFAGTTVAVLLISQRFVTRGPALLGVLVFMTFPTFFSDMPFLTRQQYAFTFLGAGLLAATNRQFSVRQRRVAFGVFSIGVLLSHYSTNYVLIAVMMLALTAHYLLRAVGGWLPSRLQWLNRNRGTGADRPRDVRFVLGIVNVAVLVGVTLLWTQAVTGTNGHMLQTVVGSVTELLHPGAQDSRSSDTGYTLVGGQKQTPDQVMANFRADTVRQLAGERAAGVRLPLAAVEAPTPVVEPENIPLTVNGRALKRIGVDVNQVNTLIRALAARMLQVFVVIGVGAVLFGYRRRWINDSAELTILAGASFVIVLTQVVLPQLSVEYGVLRAFQQSLFLLSPFLAIGMIVTFSFLGRYAATAAAGCGLTFMLSLTGVLPQVTGGYPPQLHLNNDGQYYDVYYTKPQEVAAADWALARVAAEGWSLEDNIETDAFSYARIQSFRALDFGGSLYPTQLRTKAYTLLTAQTILKGQSTVGFNGDLITYQYPFKVLIKNKNLVYTNGASAVFR